MPAPVSEAAKVPTLAAHAVIDKAFHAMMARMTLGIAPSALTQAFTDWAEHLATAPGTQMALAGQALRMGAELARYGAQASLGAEAVPVAQPQPGDRRFADPSWQGFPFNLMAQGFLAQERWWDQALTTVPGVTEAHEKVAAFVMRQMLDTVSPANFPLTNPEVLQATAAEGGMNLIRGAGHLAQDIAHALRHQRPDGAEAFQVGRDLSVTPGKVVFRNRLIELIQYAPTTATTRPEPILMVPAWIMKYYILDLSPENSLVRYLVGQGYTVFMISWLNPGAGDADLSMEDYRSLGVMEALEAVTAITGQGAVHGLGYCLGGTLLAIAAATMARDGDARFKTLTLLAAQTDFSEAGELTLFINEAQVSYLEDMMWQQGYLATDQMGGAFRLLRSADLIWSKNVHDYLMGQPVKMFDLLAWNADGTRMPATMHAQYLRQLFLRNELAAGHYRAGGGLVTVSDITAPVLAVGTEEDHVAPWKSVYKLHLLADTEVTFVLASGGHNAGIVAPPGHPNRHYRVNTTKVGAPYRDGEAWAAASPERPGSWWQALSDWLDARSSPPVDPPPLGQASGKYRALCAAPGTYVMQE